MLSGGGHKAVAVREKMDATPRNSIVTGGSGLIHLPDPGFARDLQRLLQLRFVTTANQLVFVQSEGKGIAPYEFDQLAQLLSGSLRCQCWRCVTDRG